MNKETSEPALTTPMFKLYVDCFEELFEWLSLADLRALRLTCKRLQKVVDHFIKSKYPDVKIGYKKVKIWQSQLDSETPNGQSHFAKFQQLISDPIAAQMIKELDINIDLLTKDKIYIFKSILPQVEKITIAAPIHYEGEFYESILKWCTNLKYLTITAECELNKLIGNDNRWLHHQLPSLEHLNIKYWREEIKELKIFFELNPNIKIFTTDFDFLCANRNWLLESNIQIDRLILHGLYQLSNFNFMNVDNYISQVCNILNTLYDQGFCEYIRMDCYSIYKQEMLDQILSVRGMDILHLFGIEIAPTLSPEFNLQRLWIESDVKVGDLTPFAKNLVNLEQVYLKNAKLDSIELFLMYAPKLKEIRVDNLTGIMIYFRGGIIDLARLNELRGSLRCATKVTIYIEEILYLSTKFALKSLERSLVSLKRAGEVVWD